MNVAEITADSLNLGITMGESAGHSASGERQMDREERQDKGDA